MTRSGALLFRCGLASVRPLAVLLALGGSTVAARPAWAEPVSSARRAPTPAEEQAFLAGTQALAAGDAAAAEKAFREGFALAQDPAFLVKIGEAQEKAGTAKAAALSYRRYLTLAPDASDAEEIRARAEKLDPRAPLAPETAGSASPPGANGAGVTGPAGPKPATSASPGAASPGSGTLPRAQTFDLGEIKPDVTLEEHPHSAVNVAAWIGAGTTTALLGVAAVYAAQAASKKDDVNRYQYFTDPDGTPLEYAAVAADFEKARRDGEHDDRVAKVFLWSAAATGATTIALFVVDALHTPEAPTVQRTAASAGSWRLSFSPAPAVAGQSVATGLVAGLSVPLP